MDCELSVWRVEGSTGERWLKGQGVMREVRKGVRLQRGKSMCVLRGKIEEAQGDLNGNSVKS